MPTLGAPFNRGRIPTPGGYGVCDSRGLEDVGTGVGRPSERALEDHFLISKSGVKTRRDRGLDGDPKVWTPMRFETSKRSIAPSKDFLVSPSARGCFSKRVGAKVGLRFADTSRPCALNSASKSRKTCSALASAASPSTPAAGPSRRKTPVPPTKTFLDADRPIVRLFDLQDAEVRSISLPVVEDAIKV